MSKRKIGVTGIIVLVLLIIFGVGLLVNQIIPINYRVVIFVVLAVLALLSALVLRRKVFNIILSVLLVVGSVGTFYSQSIIDRLVKNKPSTDTISYVVLANSSYQSLSDAKDATFITSKQVSSATLTKANDDLNTTLGSTIVIDSLSSYEEAVNSLYTSKDTVLVLNESFRSQIIEGIKPNFDTETRTLSSVDVVVDDGSGLTKVKDVTSDPFVVFISGNDDSGSLKSTSRSDVNMLLVVNPKTYEIHMISIPRDTYTASTCFNNKNDKLTHTGNGGVNCTITAVENLFNVKVNFYARVNFTSFMNIIKVIGNVDVQSTYAFTTVYGGYRIRVGTNNLNADQALGFVRERYSLPNGDVDRSLNQQAMIKAIIAKIVSPSSLTKINSIVSQISESVDTNMSSSELSKLIAYEIDKTPDWTFSSAYLAGKTGSDYVSGYSDPKSVYYPDAASVQAIHDEIVQIMGN